MSAEGIANPPRLTASNLLERWGGLPSKEIVGLVFILPAIVLTAVIFFYPFYSAISASLQNMFLHRPGRERFIGFENYIELLTDDEAFRTSVLNTSIFVTGCVVFTILGALVISGLLVRNRVGRPPSRWAERYQLLLLLPFLMTPAVTATVFRVFIWDYDTGIANWIARSIGLDPIPWLIAPNTAMAAIIITEVWSHIPLASLILYSAMRSAPIQPYEAAIIDGANEWQQFRHVTLPYIRPQIVFMTIMQLTLSFRQFELIFLTTGGGPGDSTRVLTIHIFEKAMQDLNFGYANAIGILSLVVVGGISAAVLLTFGRSEAAVWDK